MTAPRTGDHINNYVLEAPIGSGAFAQVWRARHEFLDEQVAIKIPTDPQYTRSLAREGAVIHGLRHPNIVRAIDLNPYAEPPYLIMELVEGPSLREVMQAPPNGRLPVGAAVEIVRGILRALEAAHAAGIVHRDVKPENVLLSRPPEPIDGITEGHVKVSDFGLGRASAATTVSIMQSGSLLAAEGRSIVGTLAYMAPEQKDGGEVDARCDLYACGIILYELLIGERPTGVESIGSLRGDVPAWLDKVFRRSYTGLARRYASAALMLEALRGPVERASGGAAREGEAPAEPVQQPASVARARRVKSFPAKFTNSFGMKMVLIPAGTFMMGGEIPPEEVVRRYGGRKAWFKHEYPRHSVTIKGPFYLGAYSVTVGCFGEFVSRTGHRTQLEQSWGAWFNLSPPSWRNPGFEQMNDHPVVNVNWNDAMRFCELLSRLEGRIYRLPTEAEWEYACRAGSQGAYCFGNPVDELGEHAWFHTNSGGRTRPVGRKNPNAWCLYDMHGNVWEWCADVWHSDYKGAPTDGSDWTSGGDASRRVVRGGSWSYTPSRCRSAQRHHCAPGGGYYNVGFRCVAGA